jgi:hypothetical protein
VSCEVAANSPLQAIPELPAPSCNRSICGDVPAYTLQNSTDGTVLATVYYQGASKAKSDAVTFACSPGFVATSGGLSFECANTSATAGNPEVNWRSTHTKQAITLPCIPVNSVLVSTPAVRVVNSAEFTPPLAVAHCSNVSFTTQTASVLAESMRFVGLEVPDINVTDVCYSHCPCSSSSFSSTGSGGQQNATLTFLVHTSSKSAAQYMKTSLNQPTAINPFGVKFSTRMLQKTGVSATEVQFVSITVQPVYGIMWLPPNAVNPTTSLQVTGVSPATEESSIALKVIIGTLVGLCLTSVCCLLVYVTAKLKLDDELEEAAELEKQRLKELYLQEERELREKSGRLKGKRSKRRMATPVTPVKADSAAPV